MDMMFAYVMSGWEGSAADSRVFNSAHVDDFTHYERNSYWISVGKTPEIQGFITWN